MNPGFFVCIVSWSLNIQVVDSMYSKVYVQNENLL